jgi:hypothetical protein
MKPMRRNGVQFFGQSKPTCKKEANGVQTGIQFPSRFFSNCATIHKNAFFEQQHCFTVYLLKNTGTAQ